MDQEIRDFENNQELDDEQLDTVVGGVSVGDVVTIRPGEIRYCSNCASLLNNSKATIVGVRGVLDGHTIYWVKRNCCGHKSLEIESSIVR